MPKSITLTPPGPRMMLPGLKSQCTMFAACTASSAIAVWMATSASRLPRSGPRPSRTSSCSVGPSTNSVTMYGGSASRSNAITWAVTNAATERAPSSSRCSAGLSRPVSWKSVLSTLTATRSSPPSVPR
jgi:hypothetical protein